MESPQIGPMIKYYRQQQGMTQMQLAERIGVSYQQLQKYENGRSELTVRRLFRVADALHVGAATLLAEAVPSRLSERRGLYAAEGYPRRSSDEQRILKLLASLRSRKLRRLVIQLLESVVEQQRRR